MEGPMNENSFNQHSRPETLGTDQTFINPSVHNSDHQKVYHPSSC